MCWRYWNRETIRSDGPDAASAPTTMERPKDIPATTTSVPDLPQLSKSVDSAPDEDAVESTAESSPLDIRPRILRQDSCSSRRDKSPRSDDFEKLFVSILKEDEPLLPSPAQQESAAPSSIRRSGSTTTEESANSSEDTSEESQPSPDTQCPSTTVIRGFSPATATVTVEQPPKTSTESLASPAAQPTTVPQRQAGTFICGASTSSSDQLSLPPKKSVATKPRQPVFQIGTSGSSEEESSMKENLQKTRSATFLPQRRQPTFPQQLPMTTSSDSADSAIADDSETDGDFDESAIDDEEDDSDWEDSDENAGNPSIDDKTYFKRVDSSANLVSRRSLLTLGLEANERQRRLGNVTSHSTSAIPRARGVQSVQQQQQQPVVGSPNDSDDSPLMMKGRQGPLKPIREAPRTAAQPIMAQGTSGHYQAALSPRTTRRHMLATELTESLRRHLLWERQQKSSTANAVLKRRHTSHDVANLKQYPERPYMKKAEDANAGSWNQYFAKEAFNGYHSKGW